MPMKEPDNETIIMLAGLVAIAIIGVTAIIAVIIAS